MNKLALTCIIVITLTVGGLIAYKATRTDKFTDGYPQARNIYIDACVDDLSTKSFCACTYDYMDKKLSNQEFQQMLGQVFIGKKPLIAGEASTRCAF